MSKESILQARLLSSGAIEEILDEVVSLSTHMNYTPPEPKRFNSLAEVEADMLKQLKKDPEIISPDL